jgi:hypothetical protein
MITSVVQRWRDHRGVYRPAGEVFRSASLRRGRDPRRHHGQGLCGQHPLLQNLSRGALRFGLYERAALVGVAVFSVPMSSGALRPLPPEASVELGRFVLLDGVKANGETWMLARCLDALRREGVAGVVMFSDPVPRAAVDGTVVFKGHLGTIYQASSATYLGRATPRTLRLLPDGRVFCERALQKIRAGERGWQYAVEQLVAAGAPPLDGDPKDWLARALPAVTRRMRHGGNHKYAIPLCRASRRTLGALPQIPYPKLPRTPAVRAEYPYPIRGPFRRSGRVTSRMMPAGNSEKYRYLYRMNPGNTAKDTADAR